MNTNTQTATEQNKQRARELLKGYGFSFAPGFGVADNLALAIASALSAKDEEIERLRDERLQVQRALASTVCEDPTEDDDPPYTLSELTHGITSLDERRRNALKRAATARTDAIRECVGQLQQLEAPDYDHGTQANGFEDGKVAAIDVLESLLNEKESK